MIAPMLAITLDKAQINDYSEWAIEEKYDGHRLVVQVHDDRRVTAWTRPRKHAGSTGKTMAEAVLPMHLVVELKRLPVGVYDGELLGGDTSTDVRRSDLLHTLRFVVFDVMRGAENDLTKLPYFARRHVLEQAFVNHIPGGANGTNRTLFLSPSENVYSQDDVVRFTERIWRAGGEGAMLKLKAGIYESNKRSKFVVKVKKLQTAVLTVVGFEATRGKVLDRGIFATVVLEDAQGNRTSVKTKDDAELDAFKREWEKIKPNLSNVEGTLDHVQRYELRCANEHHPALGRKLRIEYQDWTPKGGYRHPRWDRWENE